MLFIFWHSHVDIFDIKTHKNIINNFNSDFEMFIIGAFISLSGWIYFWTYFDSHNRSDKMKWNNVTLLTELGRLFTSFSVRPQTPAAPLSHRRNVSQLRSQNQMKVPLKQTSRQQPDETD